MSVCVCVGGVLDLNEVKLSIKSSSLSSVKAVFISLLSGSSVKSKGTFFPGCRDLC